MFFQMKAKKQGWYLTATTCIAYGMRPQVDISKTAVKKMGGFNEFTKVVEEQSSARNKPLCLINFDGEIVYKSNNWPSS